MAKRPAWYRPDTQLMTRMTLTMFLLGLVYVVFVLVLWQVLKAPLILWVVIAGVIALVQFSMADKIVLWSMNAQDVTEAQAPELHAMVSRLAQAADLPKPRIAIAQTSIANAFATGRNEKHAVICVTTGLLDSNLTAGEKEAVLAHELTHIINHDMLVMAIATFFSIVASLLTRTFFYGAMFGGYGGGYGGGRRDNNNNDNGGGAMIALLVSVAVYAISFVLIRSLSRYREYAADRGSALITGSPENLASALTKISGQGQAGRIPDRDLRQAESVSALCIVPAFKGDDANELFSTHPSLEHRIAKLQAMQEQMENAPRLH